jgi:hypothetical protein
MNSERWCQGAASVWDDDTRTSILDTRCWILDAATGSANSASDQRQQAASTTSHQRPYPSTWASRTHRGVLSSPASRAASGAHWGVPSLVFFSLIALTRRFDTQKTPRGATLAGEGTGAALPVTRQAAGVPSAGSQPSIVPRATTPMVRRSGASRREATQKAGAPENSFHQPPFRREDPHDLQV